MTESVRHRLAKCALFVTLAGTVCAIAADSLQQLAAVIREQLVYPRQARLTLPPKLPVDDATHEQNAQWLRVAEALRAAGVLKSSSAQGKTRFDPAERSTDVVVPSMNLRYELTALNVVLGYWDIEPAEVGRRGDVTIVQGKRRMTRRTRVHDLVLGALEPAQAAAFAESGMTWEISGSGASASVSERAK